MICGLRYLIAVVFGALPTVVLAQQTPPISPNVKETPVPPAIVLPAPNGLTKDLPDRPLTAAEAAQIGLKHQPNISIAIAGIIASQGRTQQARAGLMPTLGLNAGYTYAQTIASEGAATAVGTTGSGSGGTTSAGYQAGANLRQLIFDFNHTRDLVRQSALLERSAQQNLTRAQSDTVFQIKSAFYLYSQNIRLVNISQENLDNRQKQLALAQGRLKSGLGLPSDLVRAETAVSEAVSALTLAQGNASVARVNLALNMGIDPRTPIQASDAEETTPLPDGVENLVNTALRQRPEILQALAILQSTKYGVSAAKSTNAPNLAANVGLLTRGANFPPGNDFFSIGVSIQWNPFDGGFTAGRVKEARATVDIAQAQLTNAQLGVISDVSQAYLNLHTAEQRVATADIETVNALEGVRIAEGRFASGLGLFLDIIDAQSALLTARTNRSNAQFSVEQSRAALLHAIGGRQ